MINRLYLIVVLLILSAGFVEPAPVLAGSAEQNSYVRFVQKGMDQLKAGDYRAARDSFSEAFHYNDADAAAHFGLGLACYHLHEDRDAERELSRAAEIDPSFFPALQWLGEVYYRRDDPEAALGAWQKALAVKPDAEDIKARIERVRKEHLTEKDFNRELSSHFQIRYEGREMIEAGRIVRTILEDAYGEVGRSLSFYPDNEIQVILYSSKQFREVTDAPGWSGGLYDGKIRVPVGGIERETPGLRKLLYHEYTHAVVRGITRHCPTWLNEGLAQYFEGRQIDVQAAMLRKLSQSGSVPSLKSLEGGFTNLDGNQAQLAYLFSLSAVRYMVDTFGMYRVRNVLDELATGGDTGKALAAGLALSAEEFERGWKNSLE